MPGRQYSSGMGYRYGFNTQEKSDEISGVGNHTTALYWEYDSRLGRRWNLDPKPQISISDYAVNRNNLILYSDINGDVANFYNSQGKLIGSMDDGNKYITPTIVNDRNITSAAKMIADKTHNVADVQKLGLTYDVKAIGAFYNKSLTKQAKYVGSESLKNKLTGATSIERDGKTITAKDLHPEIGTVLINKNGVISPSTGEPNCNDNMTSCNPDMAKNNTGDQTVTNFAGYIHTHPEGFTVYNKMGFTTYSFDPDNPSDKDGDRTFIKDRKERDVVVSKRYIIIYNKDKKQDIKIKR